MVFVGKKAVACAKNSTLELTSKTIEEQTKDDDVGPKTEVDYVDWSMTTENLVGTSQGTNIDELVATMISCGTVGLLFAPVGSCEQAEPTSGWASTTKVDGFTALQGTGIIESISVNAPVDGKASATVKFKGAGKLTQVSST